MFCTHSVLATNNTHVENSEFMVLFAIIVAYAFKMRNHHFICKNSYVEEKTLQMHFNENNPKKGYFIKLDIVTGLKESRLSKLKTAYQNDEI